jgi:signal transduction histidine kinase/DNA-binding response OmpR family regulator/ligand-binding sensor domain-containing protein
MPPIRLMTILTLSLIGWGVAAFAQMAPAFESISTAQGLSQGMVFDLLQDKEGFIWVATKNGLNRYDGYKFKVFSNDPYNSHSLTSNTIVKLFEDSKGRIWAGTEDAGLNIYEKKEGKFYRIVHTMDDPASLSDNRIKLIEELADGRILVAVDGAGFNIVELKNDFFAQAALPVITRMSLPNKAQVYGMGKDENGTMWIGGMDGSVYRFDPITNSLTKLEKGALFNNGYITRDNSILINSCLFLFDGKHIGPLFDTTRMPPGNILFRPREKLWENHHRELYFYDVSKWESGKQVKWTEQLPATTRLLYPFIKDRSGIIWTGTVGYGLRKYNTAGNIFKALIPAYSLRWIVPVSANDIFLGDFGYGWRRLKNGFLDKDPEKDPFSRIPSVTQIDNFILSKNGDYWIKSDQKGFFQYNPLSGKLIPHPEINDYDGVGDKQPMLEDSKGFIWFPGLGGQFARLNTATGKIDNITINTNTANPVLPTAICTALYEDKEGIFWIGTQDGFAKLIFNGPGIEGLEIKWYYNSSSSRNSLNYNHVSCFLDDPAEPTKYLWVCTKGGGLNRLNKRTGDFFHLTSKNGLPDNVVYGILPDDAGNIWGSTNNGIFCLLANPTSKSNDWVFRNFTKAYGLQDNEFNTGAYKKLPDGRLAFGGVNGLNIFNPKEILATDYTPNVFITNILVGNQPVLPNDKTGILQQSIEQATSITLSHLQDILTLEFSSLDFTDPLQNKYRYQLTGIDKDWVESGTRRTATYVHLPAGKYIFNVQGSNSQGIWSNKMVQFQITVLPPWWLSWWACLCYIILAGLLARAYLIFTVNRAKLKSQLAFEQVEAKRIKELDTVKTQLYTNITHEFRTPLTVILGMAQQIISKPEEHLKNGIIMIARNGQHLLNLVNEMLDLSKLESGKMSLQLINGDVINFLRYIVESFHSLAESQQKQLHFLTELDALQVAYDPEKTRQIIANLLSNALKFTPEKGNIYINVNESTAPNDATISNLIIKIKDTGFGIPENQLQQVFDRFYQLDNSHTRKADGTGIGLALTKELVKLMNGKISIKSPPAGANKGTEFTVTLPLKKVSSAGETSAYQVVPVNHFQKIPVSTEKQTGEKPLILLVEDNADVVAYTASCLPYYRLMVARDGREGFEMAKELIPDLIITDVMMPFVDGFELCCQLRQDAYTSHIPIVMLTAKADMESKMEGLKQGADVYLEKPFYREELLIRIKKLLELRKTLQNYYLKKAGISNGYAKLSIPENEIIADPEIEDVFVKKVRTAIEENISNANFSVEQLCKLVFMSHSQLQRKLEALTGCSPIKFIRIIRFNKSKQLLKHTRDSIASVALDCGYNDPGYFARVFKQEYGVTPQEWRGK